MSVHVKGGTIVNHAGEGIADIGVNDGRITAVGDIGVQHVVIAGQPRLTVVVYV